MLQAAASGGADNHVWALNVIPQLCVTLRDLAIKMDEDKKAQSDLESKLQRLLTAASKVTGQAHSLYVQEEDGATRISYDSLSEATGALIFAASSFHRDLDSSLFSIPS
jgi:DNA-directed RNA polymerase beta' subunit